MLYFKSFKGSKLTARFFAIFIGFSFFTIIFIIFITSIIIFIKAPHFKDRSLPPQHEMTDENDELDIDRHEFDKHDLDRRRPDHRKSRFDRKHFKGPKAPPGLINDLAIALSIFAFLAVIVSFFIANYLAKYFLLPISKLADATKKFSQHDFSFRIQSDRSDEIGLLAQDFNEMADRLEKYENMKKQWIADISHELRTPITIMQAEIEAVQDSVWPLNMTTIDRLHGEIKYLAKIVNDLHRITVAENKKMTLNLEEISLTEILLDTSLRFKERLSSAGIKLEMELLSSKDSIINGDVYVIRTVFDNLFENSARYTDSPGKLRISSFIEKGVVVINFDDSPPEVPAEKIDRIFDRLFRVDSSRSRIHGGSGLGLSTSKTYVESLGGVISSSRSPLGGLRITLKFPRCMGKYDDKTENTHC